MKVVRNKVEDLSRYRPGSIGYKTIHTEARFFSLSSCINGLHAIDQPTIAECIVLLATISSRDVGGWHWYINRCAKIIHINGTARSPVQRYTTFWNSMCLCQYSRRTVSASHHWCKRFSSNCCFHKHWSIQSDNKPYNSVPPLLLTDLANPECICSSTDRRRG